MGFEREKNCVLDWWSFARGSNYTVLSGINLRIWIGGRLKEVPTIRF